MKKALSRYLASCAVFMVALQWIGGILIHLWTVWLFAQWQGFLIGVVAFFLPALSQGALILFTIRDFGLVNNYTVWIALYSLLFPTAWLMIYLSSQLAPAVNVGQEELVI